jgi:hypothetical protein
MVDRQVAELTFVVVVVVDDEMVLMVGELFHLLLFGKV